MRYLISWISILSILSSAYLTLHLWWETLSIEAALNKRYSKVRYHMIGKYPDVISNAYYFWIICKNHKSYLIFPYYTKLCIINFESIKIWYSISLNINWNLWNFVTNDRKRLMLAWEVYLIDNETGPSRIDFKFVIDKIQSFNVFIWRAFVNIK